MQESLNCRTTGSTSGARAGAAAIGARTTRTLLASMALLAGAAGAQPLQAFEPLAHEFEAGPVLAQPDLGDTALAPRLHVEIGRSPTRAAFALDISGGVAHGWALLQLRDEGGACSSQLVRLDDSGAARLLRLDHRAGGPLEVTCTLPSHGGELGLLTTQVLSSTVPSADAMIAQSRALLGYGAPTSPFAALGSSAGPASGVVITEIMKDPAAVADSAGEWFEVRNLGPTPIDLSGWNIRDSNSNGHTIPATAGVVLPPRSYFVFGINASASLNGGVTVGYKYSSFTLGNGADDIQLYDATGALVDAVAYDDGVLWPDTPGKSLSLQRALVDVTSNDDGANWCDALSPLSASSTDSGTPRWANNVCP